MNTDTRRLELDSITEAIIGCAFTVGEFVADLLVEDCVLVELKAAKAIDDSHTAQCINYLAATGLHVCLLINFGKPRVDIKRIVRDF